DDGPPPNFSGYQPLPIRYIDVNNQLSNPQGYLLSQEMSIMEPLQNKLIIPSEDYEGDDYAVCNSSSCSGHAFIGIDRSSHIYAAAEYSGNLYLAGSDGVACDATVWQSINGGDSWSVNRTMSKSNNYLGCARFTLLAVYNNKLYAQGYQYDWSLKGQSPCFPLPSVSSCNPDPASATCNFVSVPQVHILDGNTWSTSNDLIINSVQKKPNGKSFVGKLVFVESGVLKSFDTNSVLTLINNVRDYTISEGWLYVLKTSGHVVRTSNLTSWYQVDTGPSNSKSIAVLNKFIYIGTSQGQVYKSDELQPCGADCTESLPAILLLLFDQE
ncbi:MAG: hypothetical protein JKX81_12800, partial [Arenicella sp.]|nr:hypothetical protein [Arenicella sp.]